MKKILKTKKRQSQVRIPLKNVQDPDTKHIGQDPDPKQIGQDPDPKHIGQDPD
jgi:hypothetical protein